MIWREIIIIPERFEGGVHFLHRTRVGCDQLSVLRRTVLIPNVPKCAGESSLHDEFHLAHCARDRLIPWHIAELVGVTCAETNAASVRS